MFGAIYWGVVSLGASATVSWNGWNAHEIPAGLSAGGALAQHVEGEDDAARAGEQGSPAIEDQALRMDPGPHTFLNEGRTRMRSL